MRKNKLISFVTAALFAVSAANLTAAADETYVAISTAADLTALSKNCVSDSYSVGKTFVLENDIDLEGGNFDTIGSFGGTLDGRGHTIKNMTLSPIDSTRGFIGTVSETGIVKDLHIEGDISPKNTQKKEGISKITGILNDKNTSSVLSGIDRYAADDGIKSIGGIAGENKGKILGCTFSGSVTGAENIGGIAGENAQNGRIEYCQSSAVVTADTNAGGIAGKNFGVIKQSTNSGAINPTANEDAQNTGGIAGRSYGAVLESVNRAEIGYKNAGYNVGGITGCQNGYIAECVNYGHIQGRKDVGGITGQFEPYTNIDFSQDAIQQRVDENIDKLKSDLREADNNIVSRYDSLKSDIKSIDDFFGISETGNGISDTMNSVSGAMNSASGAMDSVSGAMNSASGALDSISGSISDTNSRLSGSVSDSLSDVSSGLTDTAGRLSAAADAISGYGGDLSERFSDSSQNLDNAVNDVVSILGDVNDTAKEIKDDSAGATDELIELLNAAQTALDNGSEDSEELIGKLIDVLDDADFSDVNVNVEMDDLSDSLRDFSRNLSDDLGDIAEPFIRISDALGDILDSVEAKNEAVNSAIASLKQILDDLRNLATPNPQTPDISIPTLQPSDGQSVIDSLRDIFGKLLGSALTTAYAAENDEKSTSQTLLELDIKDMDIKINRECGGEIMDAALIRYCVNEGAVDGMIDAGGIAGAVGFDSASNPEENLNVSGSYSLDPSTAIKAVTDASVNEGNITAKSTSAGGIAGFADIGTVKRSISRGEITVTEGSYAGGIAGYSANKIEKCISLCDIASDGCAGGIAGKGTNIGSCYALTRIDSDGEKLGAIAGTAEGNIRYNYFLKEDLNGIDGVNYESKAQPVTDDILAADGTLSAELKGFDGDDWVVASGDRFMPQLTAFTQNEANYLGDTLRLKSADFARFHFKVRFLDEDGSEIKSLVVDYGERIPENEIPKLKKHSGSYGDWDKDATQKIVRDTDFNCVYEKSTSTIAYGSEPAIMLVEGNFRPGAILDVDESAADINSDSRYEADRLVSFTVTEDADEYTDPITVRVMEKSKNAAIGIVENGSVTIVDSETDGSYLKFEMASPGEFVVLKRKPNIILPVCGGITGAAFITAAALFIIYRKKKKAAETAVR